jgi:hypothetical protein
MDQAGRALRWLSDHPEQERQCAGEWILVEGDRIIAHSPALDEVLEVAKAHPDALLAQAHGDEALAF